MKTIVTSRNGLQPRKHIKRGGNQNGNDGNRKCKVREVGSSVHTTPPPLPPTYVNIGRLFVNIGRLLTFGTDK